MNKSWAKINLDCLAVFGLTQVLTSSMLLQFLRSLIFHLFGVGCMDTCMPFVLSCIFKFPNKIVWLMCTFISNDEVSGISLPVLPPSNSMIINLLSSPAGTPYNQQSYKVSDVFPFKWINKKWKEGFFVTSMTTAGSRWGIVMSRNAGFSNQVVYFSKFDVLIVEQYYRKQLIIPVFSGCWTWFPLSKWRDP